MDAKSRGYACPRCTVGRCTPQGTTFADVYQGQLLCIPNIHAYICDVCHFAEFEQELLDALWQELYGEATVDEVQPVARHKRGRSFTEGSG